MRAAAASATPSTGGSGATSPGDIADAVQLQPYIVREERIPEFKDREILTTKGKIALARRRYAHFGPMSDAALLRMLEEDFARDRAQEMSDLLGLLGDTESSRDLKREIEASMRPSGFTIEFGAPFRPAK